MLPLSWPWVDAVVQVGSLARELPNAEGKVKKKSRDSEARGANVSVVAQEDLYKV